MSAAMAYTLAIDRKSASSTPRSSTSARPALPAYSVSSSSSSSVEPVLSSKRSSKVKQAVDSIKRHAKEHHQSVNAAFDAYYGGSKYYTYYQSDAFRRN